MRRQDKKAKDKKDSKLESDTKEKTDNNGRKSCSPSGSKLPGTKPHKDSARYNPSMEWSRHESMVVFILLKEEMKSSAKSDSDGEYDSDMFITLPESPMPELYTDSESSLDEEDEDNIFDIEDILTED